MRVYASQIGRVLGEQALWRAIWGSSGGKGIKVDGKEIRYPDYVRSKEEFVAYGGRLFTEQYLRKDILYAWPNSRLRKAYDLFKDELAQYDIAIMQIVSAGDVAAVAEDVQRETDFESLAARYSVDETGLSRIFRNWYSRTELEQEFGQRVTDKLLQLKPGTCTKPIQIGANYYLFHLGTEKNTFEQVRPFLEQRIVDARREALGYELLQNIQVTVSGSMGSDPAVVEYDPGALIPPPGNTR